MADATTTPHRHTIARVVLASATAVLSIGGTDHGLYHPDEIYQTLEPAHRFVFGPGLRSWEWVVGARNPALPAMLVPPLQISKWLGLQPSPAHLWPVAVLMAASTGATVAGVYRLARNWGTAPVYALGAAALFAASPAALYFGHRPLPEVLSASFVVWGIALGVEPARSKSSEGSSRSSRLIGLSLLGFAVLLRLQNALFCLVVGLLYRWFEPRERYLDAVRTFAAWGILYGVVDFIAWGIPYRSAGAYLRFNLFMSGTTDFYGASPFFAYATGYLGIDGVSGVVVLVVSLAALSRARRLWVLAGVFFLAHQLFPHRQLRYVYTLFPMLAALAGIGLQVAADRLPAPRWVVPLAATSLAAATLAETTYRWPRLEFGDLEQSRTLGVPASRSAHRFHHDLNLLLADAGRRSELCGLKLESYWAVRTGGLTYLHRDVPLYHRLQPASEPSNYNFVIRPRGDGKARNPEGDGRSGSGETTGEVVAARGGAVLVDTGRETCEPAPDHRPWVHRERE